MLKVKRFDAVQLVGEVVKTPEGYLRGDAIVTRSGVFKYQSFDGTVINELRHPDDVFKAASLDSLKMRPITLLHPDDMIVTAENAKRLSVGHTGEVVTVDAPHILVTVNITDQVAIEAVENGLRELSMGYFVVLIPENGKYDGIEYQYRQTEIDYNHLAIVDKARAGASARLNIVDKLGQGDAVLLEIIEPKEINNDSQNNEEPQMSNFVTITLDTGISYQAAPEVKAAWDGAQVEIKDLQSKLNAMVTIDHDGKPAGMAEPGVKAVIDALQGELDGVKAELEKVKAETSDEKFTERVAARTQLEKVGASVLDTALVATLATMSDADIMKAVILAHEQDATKKKELETALDGKGADYLQARFDIVAEQIPARQDTFPRQRLETSPANHAVLDAQEPDADKARDRAIADAKAKSRGEEVDK